MSITVVGDALVENSHRVGAELRAGLEALEAVLAQPND